MNALVHFYDESEPGVDALTEILDGLTAERKHLSPKFFYDERGSELFTEITRLPEYYLTRTEVGLLKARAAEIGELVGDEVTLIEYGSGSSEKIRILLEELKPTIYAPLDISGEYLAQAADQLGAEHPWLEVRATCVDFTGEFQLPFSTRGRKVAFFPGSSIGNFERDEAGRFLARIRRQVGAKGALLIGVDLKKDEAVLNAAYNDAEGITDEFNLNVLAHLNREYDADFNLSAFAHRAAYNEELGCIQMFLVSKREQTVRIGDESVSFEEGEEIHTENSHKYALDEFSSMAITAGFQVRQVWRDARDYFAVFYLEGGSEPATIPG